MRRTLLLQFVLIGIAIGGEEVIQNRPQEQLIDINPLKSYSYENNYNGTYKYRYETANDIKVEEEGYVKNPGSSDEIRAAHGSYSYTGPGDQLTMVEWYADETGFHARTHHYMTASRPEAPQPPPTSTTERPEVEQSVAITYPFMPRG